MKMLILGSSGLIGSNALKFFQHNQEFEILSSTREDLDLRDGKAVGNYFKSIKPEIVVFAAANVGGIGLNLLKPSEMLLDNIQIATNVFRASLDSGVSKLINFGSSCMYPVDCAQPMETKFLGSGPTELSSQFYSSYKLTSWKMVEAINKQFGLKWITLIPSTIFGPNDNFSLTNGHVISSLIKKFSDAKSQNFRKVSLWGDGSPLREFIYVDDLLSAINFIICNNISETTINIGTGIELTIDELSKMIASEVGYEGKIDWDSSKPNGSPRKLLDSSFIQHLGWMPKVSLEKGIALTHEWFLNSKNYLRI